MTNLKFERYEFDLCLHKKRREEKHDLFVLYVNDMLLESKEMQDITNSNNLLKA